MTNYIIRRLLLIPVTLFCIILVTFVIINLAPGDPVTVTEITQEGLAARREDRSIAFGTDMRYLQFREHYGLTLPILINLWPFTDEESVMTTLRQLVQRNEMSVKNYEAIRVRFGDKARFIMPLLLKVIEDPTEDPAIHRLAVRFFVRGGTRQAYLGPGLSEEQKRYNRFG